MKVTAMAVFVPLNLGLDLALWQGLCKASPEVEWV